MDEVARKSRFSVVCNATGGVEGHNTYTQIFMKNQAHAMPLLICGQEHWTYLA